MGALTQHRAESLFSCDFEAGILIWRERQDSEFSCQRLADSWNSKHAGKEAGWIGCDGYRRVTVRPGSYLVHRVIWLLFHGSFPDGVLDHMDQNVSNNSIHNLVAVSHSGNAMNRKISSSNTSGHVGVTRCKKSGRWRCEIKVAGKKEFIGSFLRFEDAVAARMARQKFLGFSPLHGSLRKPLTRNS